MRKLLAFIFVVLFFLSCGEENSVRVVEKPPNLIEKEKMIKVLVDFHLAEEAIRNNSRAKADYFANLYYYSLFKKHNISAADFDSSVSYYIQIPEKFDAMYADVIEELEKLDTEISVKNKDDQNLSTERVRKKPNKGESKEEEDDDEKGSGFLKKIKEKALKKKDTTKKEGE